MTYWRDLLLIFSWRTPENSVKAKFAESIYQEDKRCMLVSLRVGADFSRGCASMRLGYILLATHPHPGIRELSRDRFMPLLSPSKQVLPLTARNVYSLLRYLVLGNKLQSGEIGNHVLP